MKEKIIALLKDDYTLDQIALQLLNQTTTIQINKILKQCGIVPGEYSDRYKYTNKIWLQRQFDLYKTPSEVSKQTGTPRTCITRYARKFNIYDAKFTRIAKNNISENYFKEINTAHKAYWLGFIMADGNIYHYKDSDKVQFELKIQESDRSLLNQFAKDISFDKSKIRHGHCKRNNTDCYYASLRSYNKVFCNNLIKHGIVDRKSGKELLPKTVPDKFIRDFIRGFVDGDGNISSKIFMYSTSEMIIDQINVYLTAQGFLFSKYIRREKTHTMYVLSSAKITTTALASYLYYDGCIALGRKLKAAKELRRSNL